VGYSTLSAQDQDRAIALVQQFQQLVRRAVPTAGGRIVKFIGDAALLESPSAEAALAAAHALHAEMGEGLRTGVHLGEVTVAFDGDLYGDGVNGAQRIQTEARPGEIVVSEDVWRRLRNRPAYVFEPLGERQLKGIEPMALFRLASVGSSASAVSEDRTRMSLAARREGGAGAARPSVAVLPFRNLSPQPENDYFSDGVAEDVLTLLTRVEGLKVISRTSVMQYKGTVKPIRQIGAELGVATILEGSVRHAGSRVRITTQLVDAATDEHLWAERYDRELEDIFSIQSDVAERIVEALRLRLTSRERSRLAEEPTQSVEAYQSYLRGRYFLNRRTEAALRQGIDWLRKAVAADAQFAEAWIGLSDALTLLMHYSETPLAQVLAEARTAAEKALELDPRLGEAHASLGHIAHAEWKWQEADRHFRRALELSPTYVTALQWYAILLWPLGRLEEANELLARAMELDPLSLPLHMAMGVNLSTAGRDDEALEIYWRVLELDPNFAPAYNNIAGIHILAGRFEEALPRLLTFSRLDPTRLPPDEVARLRAGYDAGGARGFWEAGLEALASRGDRLGTPGLYTMAQVYAQLGRLDEAFAHLERVVRARHPIAPNLAIDGSFAALHGDPRFEELKRWMGLPA
jgi:TolB-like protein